MFILSWTCQVGKDLASELASSLFSPADLRQFFQQAAQQHSGHAHPATAVMSNREEQEETRSHAAPPHRSRQPNGTPLEGGGRPRWRPCQLHNLDGQGNAHHHHHHHYNQQPHQHQHQSGTSRGPPRHRRRHVPGQAQRRVSESGDAETRQVQQPRPGVSRYRRSGERGHHQHRSKQQPREGYGGTAVQQPHDVPVTDQAVDALSPEESSQELMTPSPQEASSFSHDALASSLQEEQSTSQEELTPSPQEVPVVGEQRGNSPGLHCSSSTESSFHTHLDLQGDGEQTEECNRGGDEVESNQEHAEEKDYFPEATAEERDCVAVDSGSTDGFHSHGRRAGPIRVDVPPFAAVPFQPIAMPHFQPQPFTEPLRSYTAEPKAGSTHYSPTNCTPVSTEAKPEHRAQAHSYEEPLLDSSPESHSYSFPHPNTESHPKPHQMIPKEPNKELYLTEHLEERCTSQNHQDVSTTGPQPQFSSQEKPRPMISVGSRLHHYNEQSGDEASSPDRGSSSSSFEELQELQKEQPETSSPLQDRNDSGEGRPPAKAQSPVQGSSKISGDAISLAIKDIKEAIEEVKTKTVRSPYTPDKPKEPVWVMRRDVSPAEECHPQLCSPSHPQPPSPQYKVRKSRHVCIYFQADALTIFIQKLHCELLCKKN